MFRRATFLRLLEDPVDSPPPQPETPPHRVDSEAVCSILYYQMQSKDLEPDHINVRALKPLCELDASRVVVLEW